MFKLDLKPKYDLYSVKEDYLIEDILQPCFVAGYLEEQEAMIPIDFRKIDAVWNSK